MRAEGSLSTGLPDLDQVLRGIAAGDNLVWRVESIEEYQAFVEPYCTHVLGSGGNITYLRFAKHKPVVEKSPGVEVHELDPKIGFEPFVACIQKIIEEVGPTGFYVFDCLSALVVGWCSDRMLGNFFMLTCPYVSDDGAVAYFALL